MCIYYCLIHFKIFRYRNIIPYNSNRVRLIKSVDGCDYINASWISFDSISLNDWVKSKVTFIAAQGPMLHTTEHFLQMLFDHKIDVVIMLTDIVESKNKTGENNCKLLFSLCSTWHNAKLQHYKIWLAIEHYRKSTQILV